MQFNIDKKGEFADIFEKVREILLSYPQIKELKNSKQTSYYDKYGVVVMLRGTESKFVISFGRGAKLKEKFPILQGNGKIVRHLYLKNINEINQKFLEEMIEESFILGLEDNEIKLLRRKNDFRRD